MNDKLKMEASDELFKAILLLKDVEECYDFYEDIGTVNEIKSLAQRFEVAKLLKEGETYTNIAKVTGASTATISRVNRAFSYGTGGYRSILERIKEN